MNKFALLQRFRGLLKAIETHDPVRYILVSRLLPLSATLASVTGWIIIPTRHSKITDDGQIVSILCAFLVVYSTFKIAIGIHRSKNSIAIDAWFIGFSMLLYVDLFAVQYKDFGLYATHCLPGDVICQTVPVHDGLIALYFSVITLTTVGFGDFIPATPLCRLFVSIEAITGYFFLALLIVVMTKWIKVQEHN